MRTLYLTLAFSVLAHTLALFSMSSVPEITLPANDAIVVTLTSGSIGSGSLNTQNRDSDKKQTKPEPQTKPAPHTTKKVSPTPKVLHTEEKSPTRITPPEKTTTTKAQTQESPKNTPSESQAESSNSGKNNTQNESHNGSGSGAGSGTGSGASGNQGSGKGSGEGGNGKITAPIPTYAPVPTYPSAAERLQQQGTVQVSLKINSSGAVSDVTILRSSQSSLLDNAAKRTLKSWRFKAAEQNGHAIASTAIFNILFTPEGVKVLR